jgi:hypothetical protein
MDEYCNPSLNATILNKRNTDQVVLGKRNDDQVVPGRRKKKIEAQPGPHPSQSIITVPQAWLWKVNNDVITCLPREITPENLLFTRMRHSWRLVDTGDPDQINLPPGHINLALGMFLSELINALDRPINAGLQEPIFSSFEKAISNLSDDVNEYSMNPDVESLDIKKERQFLHIIDDIREELSMISTILFQQEEVWKDFVNRAWPQQWPDGPDGRFQPPEKTEVMDIADHQEIWNKIRRPQIQFAKFKRRISKLDADAERVAKAMDRKLDLKATHASLKEAHTTAIMSAAIFGFTIITIIFTPLSFIISLFALPIDRFQKDQVASVWDDQAGMYSTNYVGKWIGEYSDNESSISDVL